MSRDGTVSETEDRITIRFERRYQHPVEKLWEAITDPAELERWLGKAEIDLVPDGRYVSYHGENDEIRVEDRILRVEPPTLFEHTFWVDNAPNSVVRWELTPVDGGCLVVLTHTFGPDEVPDRDRNAEGWQRIVDELGTHLDTKE